MAKTKAEHARTYVLKKKYHLTDRQYQQLFREQGGRCAICGRPEADQNLPVDHDHATGAIRGLLCSLCNRGLGLFGDDPDLLTAAAHYLLGKG